MKKILISLMTLVVMVGLVGAGAFAYFSDTETSTGNIFTAGTMDLSIESGPGSSPVTFNNMKPGDIETGTIVVKNTGSLTGNLYGRTTYVPADGDPNPVNKDLADKLNVTSWQDPTYGPVNPGMTLKQLVNQTHDVTLAGYSGGWMDYGALASTATGTFSMTVQFDPSAGNDYQSDGIDVTFEFVLAQSEMASLIP